MVLDRRGHLDGIHEGAVSDLPAAIAAPSAGKPLRVLIVEDSEDDADLVILELRRQGYVPQAERVENRSQLEAAMLRPWDLVICDYNLPSLDAPAALAAVRRRQADLPFLVVSGTTSEAQAVHTLLAGAQDFFHKGSLTRLGPAIERELKEAEGRKARRHAEVALRHSEQRFQEVLENVSDLIVLLGPGGEIRYASPSSERIIGFAPEELEGRRLAELAHPDAAGLDVLLAEARACGEAGRTRELSVLSKDGRQVLLDVGVKDATAKGIGYILNARDITGRRRTEKALALAEERLRLAVEAGRLGTWYMDTASGSIEVNSFGKAQIGWEPGEPLEFGSFLSHLDPADRERVRDEVGKAIRGEADFDSTFRVSRSKDDGPDPRWIHAMGRIFTDGAGKSHGFFGVALEVTEAKRAETLLVETQQRLKAALFGSSAGTFKLDFPSGRLEGDANLAQLIGAGSTGGLASGEDLLGRVHAEDRPRLASGIEAAERTGRDLDEEFRLAGSGDAERWIAVKGRTFAGEAGGPAYLMGACVDITDRRQALEQLRQGQKLEAIGKLAGDIAHDFNNLLTAINGYADLCLQQEEPEGIIKASLAEIRKAGERAATLTQQLLAYSRRQVLIPKLVSLDHVVADVERMLSRVIGEDIRISPSLRAPDLLVKIDPGQMQQVILNLAVNARDAMPNGGEIRLGTRPAELRDTHRSFHGDVPAGRYVVLDFADTGTGMPQEIMARIFEPFFTTKPVGKGTGLGLSMVYGMVRQSGGHVTVDSSPGAGTRFSIYLPCAEEASGRAAAPSVPGEPGFARRSILLVEDEESVLRYVAQVLESNGFLVHKAGDASAALEIADRGAPVDLLVTDVIMNGMGGPELWQVLRGRHPGLHALFISGYPREDALLEGTDGQADYLQKPFSASQLLEKMAILLRSARRLHAL